VNPYDTLMARWDTYAVKPPLPYTPVVGCRRRSRVGRDGCHQGKARRPGVHGAHDIRCIAEYTLALETRCIAA